MMSRTVLACMSTAFLLALPLQIHAQGVVKGAQEGAAVGNKAAGPVGGAVGGAVGGIFGGVAGGVKGVLGIPQSTSNAGTQPAQRSSTLSRSSIKSELLGRPLKWTNADGTQSGTTVFYLDNTATLTNTNLSIGADDRGRWSMKNNRLCVTWEKIRPNEENCSTWTRLGPKTYRDSDGITFTAN